MTLAILFTTVLTLFGVSGFVFVPPSGLTCISQPEFFCVFLIVPFIIHFVFFLSSFRFCFMSMHYPITQPTVLHRIFEQKALVYHFTDEEIEV